MSDDVGYVEKGPKGKTCSDCKNFNPDPNDSIVGECMGEAVSASASCNYFEPKEAVTAS